MSNLKRIYIEITNHCNLRCSFCAFHHRQPREMSCAEFEHILKEVRVHTSYIYLHVQGEPLLHSQFDKILDLCDQYEMHVQLVTNGTYLCNFPLLHHHKSLRKISFSLHSLDYQTIDVETYMTTILQFIENYTLHQSGYCELRFWASDNLNSRSKLALNCIQSQFSLTKTQKENSFSLSKRVYLHFEKQFIWPSILAATLNLTGTCRGSKDMIALLSDGTVVPCCLDCDGKIDCGNIYTTPLSQIISSPRYTQIKKGFNDNKLVEPLCQKCQYRTRFD